MIFSDSLVISQVFGLKIFFSFLLFGFILDFIQNIYVLTRLYSLDIISITIPDFASDFDSYFFYFLDSFFLASISTCFSIVYSML